MIEPDIGARDYITEICRDMAVGWHQLFHTDIVSAAWPPTGEMDDRPTALGVTVGEFKSLAAAFAGNRPIGGETTIEQMRIHLGDEFLVHDRAEQCAVEVHRVRDRNAKPAVRARARPVSADQWVGPGEGI